MGSGGPLFTGPPWFPDEHEIIEPDHGLRHPHPGLLGLLSELGVHGLNHLELAVLTWLVVSDNLLLTGPPGTAKSALCCAIARALKLEVRQVSGEKAALEDLIGYPSPKALQEGRVEYLPSKLSLFGAEFCQIDELDKIVGRGPVQARLLELVRSGSLIGVSLRPKLQYVAATMNPPGQGGSRALDPAMADRFALVLPLPEAVTMDADAQRAIITSAGPDDSPGVEAFRAAAPNLNAIGKRLRRLIDDARAALPDVIERWGERTASYVQELCVNLAGCTQHPPTGRRSGFLYRGLLASIAVSEVCGHEVRPAGEHFISYVELALPYRAMECPLGSAVLENAHAGAARVALDRRNHTGAIRARALALSAPDKVIDAYAQASGLQGDDGLDEVDHDLILDRLLQDLASSDTERALGGFRNAVQLARTVLADPGRFTPGVVERVLAAMDKVSGLGDEHLASKVPQLATLLELETTRLSPLDAAALRVSLHVTRHRGGSWNPPELHKAAHVYRSVRTIISDASSRATRKPEGVSSCAS